MLAIDEFDELYVTSSVLDKRFNSIEESPFFSEIVEPFVTVVVLPSITVVIVVVLTGIFKTSVPIAEIETSTCFPASVVSISSFVKKLLIRLNNSSFTINL